MSFDFDTYLSTFTWRYGSTEMREIWSETYKRKLWRRLWVALARAQQRAGLVRQAQVDELEAHKGEIDVAAAHAIEAQIHHDLMAEVRVFAEQCPNAGGIIHLGATSMDIEDNADAMRLRDALDYVIAGLRGLLAIFCDQIEQHANLACMGHTHIQPAEPTTVGFRLAQYAQDLHTDLLMLHHIRAGIRGKGFRGAVGTAASYHELLSGTGLTPQMMEQQIMAEIGLEAFDVTTQTYPRKQDWHVLNALAGLAGSIYKFSLDLRILQAPPYGEWAEPFGKKQVGSSAMPFKRNPIRAERLSSLGRLAIAWPHVAWDNAAHSMLERTLDDSANRRTILPQSFLLVDEMLRLATRIVKDLRLDTDAIGHNLERYGIFSAVERVLMALGRAGADRQAMHEILREHSMAAWEAVSTGQPNPLVQRLSSDDRLLAYLSGAEIVSLLDASEYTGDAAHRARQLVELIRTTLQV
ncbi:MAG: adenylosuccinate lyase [Chloroflexi bacterium]|nr:adenylosuccinate lyase [Chloroflexota bacterium]